MSGSFRVNHIVRRNYFARATMISAVRHSGLTFACSIAFG